MDTTADNYKQAALKIIADRIENASPLLNKKVFDYLSESDPELDLFCEIEEKETVVTGQAGPSATKSRCFTEQTSYEIAICQRKADPKSMRDLVRKARMELMRPPGLFGIGRARVSKFEMYFSQGQTVALVGKIYLQLEQDVQF